MKQSGEMRRENGGDRFGIIHTLRADVPAPASVNKNQTLRMLNQVGEDGQCDSVLVRCSKLLCRIPQIDPVAIRHSLGNADDSALKNMNIDRPFPLPVWYL